MTPEREAAIDAWDDTIRNAHLSRRAANTIAALTRTVDDARELTVASLLGVSNCGRRTTIEVIGFLRTVGITLPDEHLLSADERRVRRKCKHCGRPHWCSG